jgi:hypothetical protein
VAYLNDNKTVKWKKDMLGQHDEDRDLESVAENGVQVPDGNPEHEILVYKG